MDTAIFSPFILVKRYFISLLSFFYFITYLCWKKNPTFKNISNNIEPNVLSILIMNPKLNY